MHVLSGAPNMRGKFLIHVAVFCYYLIYCYRTLGFNGFVAHNTIMLAVKLSFFVCYHVIEFRLDLEKSLVGL